jgi:hypothetical protein
VFKLVAIGTSTEDLEAIYAPVRFARVPRVFLPHPNKAEKEDLGH